MGACAGYEGCKLPKVCVVVNNEPKCICEECESELNEVCASDGITYANPCKMRLEACKTGRNIYEKYHGICEGCVNVRCEFYAQCVSDEYGNGICKCPNDCDALQSASSPHSTTKVCATDGLTYDSECAMKQAACKQQKFIVIAFYGACDSCANVVCPYGQLCQDGLCTCPQQCPSSASSQQVCGEDGIVYRSECHLQMAACNLGTPIRMMPLTHCRALRAGDAYTSDRHNEITDTNDIIVSSLSRLSSLSVSVASKSLCATHQCAFGGFCMELFENGYEECICDFNCDHSNAKYNHITGDISSQYSHDSSDNEYSFCASDHNVYTSTCYMDLASCLQQIPIYQIAPIYLCHYSGTFIITVIIIIRSIAIITVNCCVLFRFFNSCFFVDIIPDLSSWQKRIMIEIYP
ncbi:unnamed protein product [Anisakis simplex]|uniref:AGRin (Synaptic protein) homolog family member (inferred by orthology to a C. elegans protein) n=1 Tax=Anisakis simplex TaxID=6269 RepID=A0A0M3KDP7_ANISI|nr:unnamed protein product [Anisakis simplex]